MRKPDIFALFLPEIRELIEAKNFEQIKPILDGMHAMDISTGFSHLMPDEKILIFKLLPARRAIQVFEDLRRVDQAMLINGLKNGEMTQVLNDMAADVRANLFKDFSESTKKKLLSAMKAEEAEDVRHLLKYEEGTAGGLMTTEFVTLKSDMTARKALTKLQDGYRAGQAETIYTAYVTDDNRKLTGGVPLQELVLAPPDMPVSDLMKSFAADLIKINVHRSQEVVIQRFRKYDLHDAPVVDDDGRLVGVITVDDILDLMKHEADKQVYALGKVSEGGAGAEMDYSKARVLPMFRRRFFWLLILLLIGLFVSGQILRGYEESMKLVVVLAAFIPMLMDSGGNAGQQSLCMVVRGLGTGDIYPRDILKVIWKELLTSLLVAPAMGLAAGLCAFVLLGDDISKYPNLPYAVAGALACVVMIATVTGAVLPMFFKKVGLDPAVAASPFITTVVDATCLVVYFEMARLIGVGGLK
ncbi:MAG: magnesium transporter [Planctomycetota bacterium]|nr:magnesium transporter [Planctomycetota bacterium]